MVRTGETWRGWDSRLSAATLRATYPPPSAQTRCTSRRVGHPQFPRGLLRWCVLAIDSAAEAVKTVRQPLRGARLVTSVRIFSCQWCWSPSGGRASTFARATTAVTAVDRPGDDGGQAIGVHVVGVVEFDAANKITSWRDYLDSREIATKLRGTGRIRTPGGRPPRPVPGG
jgi:hypothetical protein